MEAHDTPHLSLTAGGRERFCALIHGLFLHVQCALDHCNGRYRGRPSRRKRTSSSRRRGRWHSV